jgi:hypothetical protein
MQHKRLLMAGLALLGAGGIGVGTDSGAAFAQPSMTFLSPAQLVARGAGVNVSVTVSCDSPDIGSLQINLSQRSANQVTQGQVFFGVTCTSSSQTVVVSVPANAGLRPFAQGTALATGSLSDFNTGALANASATLRIVKTS